MKGLGCLCVWRMGLERDQQRHIDNPTHARRDRPYIKHLAIYDYARSRRREAAVISRKETTTTLTRPPCSSYCVLAASMSHVHDLQVYKSLLYHCSTTVLLQETIVSASTTITIINVTSILPPLESLHIYLQSSRTFQSSEHVRVYFIIIPVFRYIP